MNKRVLAVTASAFALAAMPVVGVFAKEGDVTTLEDTINITVDASCTLGTAAGKTINETVSNGTTKDNIAGSKFTITCNDGTGWHVSAKGSGTNGTATQLATTGGAYTIDTNASFSSSVSGWAFKVAGTGAEETYQNFAAIPGEDATIAKGTSPVVEQDLTVTYGVGIDADQQAGTYEGKVTYTLAQGPGE